MKKSLLALAALAACAGAYADVAITGTVAMGYKATNNIDPATATGGIHADGLALSGLGVDTSTLTFTANEDLGGGQKIVASLGFDGVNRSGVGGGDTKLTYTNNAFGRIELGAAKDSDVFSSIAYGGANLITFDGKLNQRETSSDYISYAAPIGPVIFVFKHSEASNGLGLGAGTQGSSPSTTQGNNTFALVYQQGGLSLVGAYRSYTNRDETGGIFDGNSLTKRDVQHLEAGYDLGPAKVGFGYDHANVSWGITQDNVIFGVSAPVGAWTLGAAWESSKVNGVTDAPIDAVGTSPIPAPFNAVMKSALNRVDGVASGLTVSAQYNFSKRTNLAVRYASWTRSGYEQFEAFGAAAAAAGSPLAASATGQLGYKQNETQTDILLTHSF